MEKVLMFCCYFEPIETARGYVVYQYFKKNFDTKLVYSSYSHIHKDYIVHENDDYIPVKCIRYKKNMSLMRILSYFDFAFKTRKLIEQYRPDLLYIQVPPNSAAYFESRQAKKLGIPVIVDILDLWPESLPVADGAKKALNLTIGRFWSLFRTCAIRNADMIMSESQYFLDYLKTAHVKKEVIHLSKTNKALELRVDAISMEKIIIAFLGSISSISDFDSLINLSLLLKKKGRRIQLSIIGEGTNRINLLKLLDSLEIDYVYYGKVFDEDKKREILQKAWFGFNGYKLNTEVALSYKSIDYLSFALPIISNVKGDTWNIVEKNNIGYNYTNENLDVIAEKISKLTFENVIEMKKSSSAVFDRYFSFDVFKTNMDNIVSLLHC